MEYKVLKDWGDHKEGEVVKSLEDSITPEGIAKLIEEGFIAPIFNDDDYEDKIVTEQDLIENPAMVSAGIIVGDKVQILKDEVKEKEILTSSEPIVKKYNEKLVISDGYRQIGEIYVRHIRLEDGSTYDLSEEDYQNMLVKSK